MASKIVAGHFVDAGVRSIGGQTKARCVANSPAVLIVSPYFPPSTAAGVHRARHLAKHLPTHGWRPIIVRVNERHYVEPLDLGLADLVPARVEQLRTGAVAARSGRIVGIGDIGLRGFFPIKTAIQKLASQVQPAAILITGSPFYPMLLAGWIRRRLELPVILDFQDPWASSEGATRRRWSKGWLAHQLAVTLEPRAVRRADFITSVSERQNEEMAARYPWLDRARMAAIPIGGDPDDFDALRAHPPANRSVALDATKINLSYVGTFLPRAGPLVRAVFRAMGSLRQSHPDLAGKVRLNFVGTSNQPNGHGAFRVRLIAQEEGVDDLLVETPQRVPFLEALSILANSQGLLLIGSDEPHYTASKIYPALMSGRPYVSLFHRESSAHAILQAAGGGRTYGFGAASELPALESQLKDALFELATTPERLGRADPAAYSAYTADSVSAAFARVFETVSSAVAIRSMASV
jgi:hypothetical protein